MTDARAGAEAPDSWMLDGGGEIAKPVEPDVLVDLVDRLTANARGAEETPKTPKTRAVRADALKRLEKTLEAQGVQIMGAVERTGDETK